MPDFGLTEALEAALKAGSKTSIVPAEEGALAAGAAKTTPAAAAPVVPTTTPSARTAPATPAPDAVQAPTLNPSLPPPDIAAPPPVNVDENMPAPQPVAAQAADTPPPSAAPAGSGAPVEPAPVVPTPAAPATVAPGNGLPPQAVTPSAVSPSVQATAEGFLKANLSDFADKLDLSHMPNVDVMTSPDGVKAAVLKVADDNAPAITAARRGKVSDEQLIGLAQDLSVNSDVLKQVMTREFGTTLQRPEVMLAARMVEQQQIGTLLGLADRVASGSATSEEITRFEQQMQTIAAYRAQLSGAQAEWGRAGRGLQIPVGLPPAVMDHVANVLKQNNPDMQATAKAIKLAGTPSGIASIVQGSLAYRALVKAPFNILQRVFINGILSGPPTWAKILVGNNLNLTLNSFDLFAAGIGRGMAGLASRLGAWPTAEEGVQLSDAYAHLHGVISGGADGLRVVGRILKSGQSLDGILRSAEDFGATKVATGPDAILPELRDSYFGGIARVLGHAIDAPGTRLIGSIDAFTRTLGERGYLTMMSLKDIRARILAGTLRPGDAEAEMVRMMQDPSEEMAQAAALWGRRQTFQTPWPEGGIGEKFQEFLSRAPALKLIFPFMRTATNIFKQSLAERTPLAIFSARVMRQIAAGGFEGDIAKARIATGTAIGSMLAWMAIHDRITGDAPKDPKARAAWELDGRAPYSIRVTDPLTGKDTWRSYTWFEPLATIAGVVADSVQLHSYISQYEDTDTLMDHEDWLNDARSHIMASIIQNTGNKTFMQGASQFAEMYNDPQRAYSMWADQIGASMVPFSGAFKFARNIQDPYLRQAFTLLDKIRNEMPTGLGIKGSKSLPARLDVFGQPRKTMYGNSILGPLSPLPGSPVSKDDVTEEIHSLMDQTRTVPITMPSKRLALGGSGKGLQDGAGMRLTPQEYNDYVYKSRADPIFNGGTTTFKQRLSQLIASPLYQAGTPAERVEYIAQIQRAADRAGRQSLWDNNDDFRERMQAWTAEKNRLKFGQ